MTPTMNGVLQDFVKTGDSYLTETLFYVFFWVIPRRLNFIFRRFGTLCLFHLHRQVGVVILHLSAYEDGTDRVFRNVGI